MKIPRFLAAALGIGQSNGRSPITVDRKPHITQAIGKGKPDRSGSKQASQKNRSNRRKARQRAKVRNRR